MSRGLRVPLRNAMRSTDRWLCCREDVAVGGGVSCGAGLLGGGGGVELSSQRMREVWVVVGDSWGRREDKMGEW